MEASAGKPKGLEFCVPCLSLELVKPVGPGRGVGEVAQICAPEKPGLWEPEVVTVTAAPDLDSASTLCLAPVSSHIP